MSNLIAYDIKQVLLGSNSKWMALLLHNDFWYSAGFPLDMLARLDTFYNLSSELKQGTIGPNQVGQSFGMNGIFGETNCRKT